MPTLPDGTPTRAWYRVAPDGKIHGVEYLTDARALTRLEEYLAGFGPEYRPLAGADALKAELLDDPSAFTEWAGTLTQPAPYDYWGSPFLPEFEAKEN